MLRTFTALLLLASAGIAGGCGETNVPYRGDIVDDDGNNGGDDDQRPNNNDDDPNPEDGLRIEVFSPMDQEIAGLQFNYCFDPDGGAPADCWDWKEGTITVNWADSIVFRSENTTGGTLRFNVSYFLDESDIGNNGELDGTDADDWLAVLVGNGCGLNAVVLVDFLGEEHDDSVGAIEYDTGCSATLRLDRL